MNLTAKKRGDERKSYLKQMRREGNIPGVFYSPGQPAQSIEVNGKDFETALREIKKGMLSTSVFNLTIDGKKCRVIVKDIQYAITTYAVTHIDFVELHDNVPVQVKVPVNCIGVTDCVGIKLGGFLRQVIRTVKVECLPKHIPSFFEVDVRELGVRQAKRLSDLAMPKGVKPLAATDEVVVVIAKR